MKKAGIVYHPLNEGAVALAGELGGFLDSMGLRRWLCSAWEDGRLKEEVKDTDLILTLGGDGTILRAAQVAAPHGIPITGINLGRLGFMTELGAGEIKAKLPGLLAGGGWIDERAMLEAEVIAGGESCGMFIALNDVVIARGEIARIIDVEASLDGQPFTKYRADGVIVSTATGSTGYALSAGGPVMHPQAGDMLLVSILPYLSLRHPLVVPRDTEIELKVGAIHRAVLSIDGHICRELEGGSIVRTRRSQLVTRFLRACPRESFYSLLEKKLRG
jgi:NAD+ kinase